MFEVIIGKNSQSRVIYGPAKLGAFSDFLLCMTWVYGHQVAWIDGHQAVMCLHYTMVEEVKTHLQLKIGNLYLVIDCKTHHLTKIHCSFYHGRPEIIPMVT